MKIYLENELNSLIKSIQNLFEKELVKLERNKGLSELRINTNKGFTTKMLLSLLGSTISGIAVRTGLIFLGESLLAATAAGVGTGIASSTFTSAAAGAIIGPWGIALGVGIRLSISAGTLLVNYFSKEKRYKKGLQIFKEEIINIYEESEDNCLNDFILYKNEFFKGLALKINIIYLKEINIDKQKWEDIKNNYNKKKNNIMKKINSD